LSASSLDCAGISSGLIYNNQNELIGDQTIVSSAADETMAAAR